MDRTSSHRLSLALVAFAIAFPAGAANHSYCDNWSDADFAADANESPELLNFITAPERMDADLDYNEQSPDKLKVDAVYQLDSKEKIRCNKLAVRDGKISLRQAIESYTKSLSKFRGCEDKELKALLENQRKRFA